MGEAMKTHKEISLGRDLARTVTSSALADCVIDAAEVALDNNLADGVLKELPIIGAIVKLAHASQSITEALFVRKLLRFLTELQSAPVEERKKLLDEYPDSSDRQKVLGENLLLAIERMDDTEKPKILARFFTAFVKSEIDYVTFTRLARSLERFNLALLPALRKFYSEERHASNTDREEEKEEMLHDLSLTGLVAAYLSGAGAIGGGPANYRRSELGRNFLRIGFGIERKNHP